MSAHWAVEYVWMPEGEPHNLGERGTWKSTALDPIKASEGARGRCTLSPLSKKAEDICEVAGVESLVYTMTEITPEVRAELEALDE